VQPWFGRAGRQWARTEPERAVFTYISDSGSDGVNEVGRNVEREGWGARWDDPDGWRWSWTGHRGGRGSALRLGLVFRLGQYC
jgi:hypothetical protein